MLFDLIRPALFALDAEVAHHHSLNALAAIGKIKGPGQPATSHPVNAMGLHFPNRIGLAAGLDKNGEAVDGLAGLGFGSIEVGTVTPRPQPGNPKPRLFRLPEAEGIINRMGFNNGGIDALLGNIASSRFVKNGGILGINIGKNFDTPVEKAADDYLICLEKAYAAASYVTVNISSPNTKNLRDLQGHDALDDLLRRIMARRESLAQQHGRQVPVVLKIAPDLDSDQIQVIADALRRHRVDGVIATNTTLSREGVAHLRDGNETGGLSGAPLFERSTDVVRQLAARLNNELPIIAAGGIMSGDDARQKIDAGASLVQIYSGLIFRGPCLVQQIARALASPP